MIRDNIEKSDLENLGNFYLRLESLAIKPFLKKSLVDFLKSALGRIDFGELSSLLIKIIFAEIKNDVSANIKDLQATRSLILEALKPNNTTQTKITMAIILDNDLKKLMNESPDLKPDEKIMLDGERVKIQRQLLANN